MNHLRNQEETFLVKIALKADFVEILPKKLLEHPPLIPYLKKQIFTKKTHQQKKKQHSHQMELHLEMKLLGALLEELKKLPLLQH